MPSIRLYIDVRRLCALTCIALCFGRPIVVAQVPMPEGLLPQFEAAGVELLFPVDAGYKWFILDASVSQPCPYGMYSRQEHLEIRYLLEPYDTLLNPEADFPHFWAMRQVINLASNDEEDLITAHSLSDSMLSAFKADWGKLFFFHPKKSFSPRENCQFLALFREGKGAVGLFFLFDEPTAVLEKRLYGVVYKD